MELTAVTNDVWFVLLAAPNQFAGAVVGGQPGAPMVSGQPTGPMVSGQPGAPMVSGHPTGPVVGGQSGAPVVSGQPTVSAGGMQFVPQLVNYPGVPQQFVPAGYSFYAPPVMAGAAVPGGFTSQFSAVNGATTAPGTNTAMAVGAGTQQTAAPSAAGSWPSQPHQVVNPFLVSI